MRVFAQCSRPRPMPFILLAGVVAGAAWAGEPLSNGAMTVRVDTQQGSWSVGFPSGPVIVRARAAVLVEHRWVRSSDYPHRAVTRAAFTDGLGSGTELAVTCSGLAE